MKNRKGLSWICIGLLLIAAALSIIGYNIWEDKNAEASVKDVMRQMETVVHPKAIDSSEQPAVTETVEMPIYPETAEIPDYILNPNMDMPTVVLDGYEYLGIVKIPDANIELPVIAAWNYPALKRAPCRFSGSVYTDDMIIAGHNYSAHFKQLNTLKGGEEVLFTDIDGNIFSYTVSYAEIVNGTDAEGMTAGEWDMTLFTCSTDGKCRVVVRCEREDTVNTKR